MAFTNQMGSYIEHCKLPIPLNTQQVVWSDITKQVTRWTPGTLTNPEHSRVHDIKTDDKSRTKMSCAIKEEQETTC